jgi:hypothetical protein
MRNIILLCILIALLIFLLLIIFIFQYKLDSNSSETDIQDFELILSIATSDRPNVELLRLFNWDSLSKALATLLFTRIEEFCLPFDAGFEFLVINNFEYFDYFYNWTIF